jgi:hypothetical protein
MHDETIQELELEDGCKYTGEIVDNLRHGFGKGVWKNKTYKGYWKNDLYHGSGVEQHQDGSGYAGDFFEGKKTGNGKQFHKDGSFYEGRWENDKL